LYCQIPEYGKPFMVYVTCMQFDIAFIKKLKTGNKKSFEQLFLNTYESLCEYSASITGCPYDSEEVVQDVFSKVWLNRGQLNESVNIKAYLFKSVKNQSLDLVQKNSTRRKYHDQMIEMKKNMPEYNPDPKVQLIQRVREEIENLPEKCREIYLLHRRDGLTYAEIAKVLDISVKTVEARMTKTLKILRSRLQDENDLYLLPLLAILTF
jgi:RNA polymerase sigma-70 factor (family 1)